ncbi:MAG TPA: SGNH/GDSL hydrolase family protein [Bryobacteraceae bacterium]
MKKVGGSFWASSGVIVLAVLAMAALVPAATVAYRISAGRVPAMWVAVMRSREIMDNAGVRGYYERLMGKYGRMDKIYLYDNSFRIFRLMPNLTWQRDLITTNSFGLVGPERTLEKPPHTRRIALIGASLDAGQLVPEKQIYGQLLEDRLNADRPNGPGERFEVLNFSCISYTLPQIVDTAIEDAPRFDPDVYLIDVNELAASTEWSRHMVQITQQHIDPKYGFLREILQKAGVSATDSTDILYGKLAPYRIPIVQGFLQTLEDNIASRHASLIVMLVPAVEAGELSKQRVDTVREVIRGLHVPVVDLLDSFREYLYPAQLAAYPGDIHPNRRGHALIFQNLYTKLHAQPEAWRALVGQGPSRAPAPPQ